MNWRTVVDQLLPAPVRRGKAQAGRWARYVIGRFKSVRDTPVFVLGNQKSGTTVIAAALAHCADLSATLDLRDLTADMLVGVYRGDVSLDAFVDRYRRAFSRDLIKEPNLTFLYDRLAEHFPEATFILVVRDPRDNLRSFLNGFHLPGDQDELGAESRKALNPVWRAIVLNEGLGINARNYVDGLAGRWNRAADVYLEHPKRVHLIRYGDFCSDKVGAIQDLADRVGCQTKNDPEPVVSRQHQGRGNRDVGWEEFFGSSNLSIIEERCESRMEQLGYPRN